jgi:hypothetical protein
MRPAHDVRGGCLKEVQAACGIVTADPPAAP